MPVQLMFSTFLECSRMSGVFYHSLIIYTQLRLLNIALWYRFYTHKTIKHIFLCFILWSTWVFDQSVHLITRLSSEGQQLKSANQIASLPVRYSLSIGPGTVPNDPAQRFSCSFTSFFFPKVIYSTWNVTFVSFQLCFSSFWKHQMWVNVQFVLNKNCTLNVYGVFAVYHLGFSS